MARRKGSRRPAGAGLRTPVWVAAWLYETAMGAATGEVRLRDLQMTGAFTLLDVASLTWFPGAHRPRVGYGRRAVELPGRRPPPTVLSSVLRQVLDPRDPAAPAGTSPTGGVDEQVLTDVRAHLHPGRSVLLVVSTDIDLEVVGPLVQRGLARRGVQLVAAPLDLDELDGLQLTRGRPAARARTAR